MKISRVWCMPNKWTFKIKPIKELVDYYVINGKDWIDPFAGYNSPAEFTNDLNPDTPTTYHLDALEFAKLIPGPFKGCIFDPPYSLTQVARSYKDFGLDFKGKENPTGGFPKLRDEISSKMLLGSIVIYFGWNSNAFGKKRGFEIVEVLLVAHGSNRNDTICTVEVKVR